MNARDLMEQLLNTNTQAPSDVEAIRPGVAGLLAGAGSGFNAAGLSALGALAYNAYQRWQEQDPSNEAPPDGTLAAALSGRDANAKVDRRCRALLRSMIAAALADGEFDAKERAKIDQYLAGLPELDDDLLHFIKDELKAECTPDDVAQLCESPEMALELYLAALFTIDVDTDAEREWLQRLAAVLGISPRKAMELERDAQK